MGPFAMGSSKPSGKAAASAAAVAVRAHSSSQASTGQQAGSLGNFGGAFLEGLSRSG